VPPKVARVQMPAEGCAALITQQIVGENVTVVSAFQNVAAELMASDAEMACDVLVTGDKLAARETIIRLAEQAKFKAWHAGPLANSAATEALTSVPGKVQSLACRSARQLRGDGSADLGADFHEQAISRQSCGCAHDRDLCVLIRA